MNNKEEKTTYYLAAILVSIEFPVHYIKPLLDLNLFHSTKWKMSKYLAKETKKKVLIKSFSLRISKKAKFMKFYRL